MRDFSSEYSHTQIFGYLCFTDNYLTFPTSRSHGKTLHHSGGPGISHIALDQLSHGKGSSSVTLRRSPFGVDCLTGWLYLCLYWDTIMLPVEWDFNNFPHLWLIPVRISCAVCHISNSSLISTTFHFLMMFPLRWVNRPSQISRNI